jgi:hypothetical protein
MAIIMGMMEGMGMDHRGRDMEARGRGMMGMVMGRAMIGMGMVVVVEAVGGTCPWRRS